MHKSDTGEGRREKGKKGKRGDAGSQKNEKGRSLRVGDSLPGGATWENGLILVGYLRLLRRSGLLLEE